MLRFRKLHLQNWKNFEDVEVDLQDRMFLIGPNASGKSNLLDALRFLRDLASTGGGFGDAVRRRGGVSTLRCLAARRPSHVTVGVELESERGDRGLTSSPSGRTVNGALMCVVSAYCAEKRPL